MTGKQLTAALTVVLLLVATFGGVVGVAVAGAPGDTVVASHQSDDDIDLNETEPADEAYVADDGDVVLVYDYDEESEQTDKDFENVSAHAGLNTSAGLGHFNVTGEGIDSEVTGSATAWASPDWAQVNGTMTVPRPDAIEYLRLDAVSERNASDAGGSLALNSTFALEGNAALANAVIEAKTSGYVTSGPTSLTSEGSASTTVIASPWDEREHRVLLTEDDGSYTLEVTNDYPLSPYEVDRWESRDRAKQTLERQFCQGFGATDADCSVTIESYELTEGDNPRLDITYSVTFAGVDETVSKAIVRGLTLQPDSPVTTAQAEQLADRIENVTLSRVEAALVLETGEATATWNVSIDGTDDLTLAYADVLDVFAETSTPMGTSEMAMFGGPMQSPGELADQLRNQTEARREAGLSQTNEWRIAFRPDGDRAHLNATITTETENWASYVDELESRDVQVIDRKRTELEAETAGEQIEAGLAVRIEDEGMYDRMLQQYNETFTRLAAESDSADEVAEFFRTVERAGFTRARMDVGVTQQAVTAEGALAVDNASAIAAKLPEPASKIEASYTDIDEGRTVVRLDSTVDPDADTSAVEDLAFVGEETTIHMPGDWSADEQSFDSLDTEYVRSYLGLTDSGDSGSGDGLPMLVIVGGGAAVTAAAGGGLLLLRQ